MTRPITDEDRRLFATLNDSQIADILSHENETNELADRQRANRCADLDARILHHFGYRGLCDYLDALTGSHELAAADFEDILQRAELIEYARDAELKATIASACDASTQKSADEKNRFIKNLMKPLEDEGM